MPNAFKRMTRRARRAAKRASDAVIGALAVGLIKGLRLIPPDALADFAGWTMRVLGPLLPENKLGRANLTAAFPEKIGGRDRCHPARRMGQSRTHGRRIRLSRPAVGS
jgi:KDO2-lipid IV(A) lauroyltransferase